MKTRIFTTILMGSLGIGATSSSASTFENDFVASGRASVVAPPLEAERDMEANARDQCAPGTVAVQVSATQFGLYPRAFPTVRIATAYFICEQKPISSDVSCRIYPGQLGLHLAADRLSATVVQRNYALSDGPATDLARTLEVLPPDHHGAGVASLNINAGLRGGFTFKLTDGSIHAVAVTNLKILVITRASSAGPSDLVLQANAGTENLLTVAGPVSGCKGL